MKNLLEVLFVIFVIYGTLVYWLVFWHGPFQIVYESWMGWVLRVIFPHEEAMTIGARCYVYDTTDVAKMTPERRKHEEFHYTDQWRRHPLTFFPQYFYQLIRYGYDKMPLEQAARAAAGEPIR